MALTDKKVTDALLQTGVVSAPDKLTGTAAENKAVFDRLIRGIAAGCINPVIDELAGEGGAGAVGGAVDGMAAKTVQGLLAALKTLCDQRYTKAEVEALARQQTGGLVQNVTVDDAGVWTFTRRDGTRIVCDTKLEKVVVNFRLDGDALVLRHDDGSEERVSVAAFRDHHAFADSGTVGWTYAGEENNRTFTARIRPGSVTLELLALDAVSKIEGDVSACVQNAAAALEARRGAEAAKAGVDRSAQAAQAAAGQAGSRAAQAETARAAAVSSAGGAANSAGAAAGSAKEALDSYRSAVAEAGTILQQTREIKDSTGITASIDDAEDTGYRVGFQRADAAAPVWTPPLQAQVSVGNVTTAQAGQSAAVTARGTGSRRILDFTIPTG